MNNITINGKDYNRDELSQEVNQLIDHITFIQGERQRQRAFIDAAELGEGVMLEKLTVMLNAEAPSKPEGDLVSKSLSLDSDVEGL